jgi:hypothetical protein
MRRQQGKPCCAADFVVAYATVLRSEVPEWPGLFGMKS